MRGLLLVCGFALGMLAACADSGNGAPAPTTIPGTSGPDTTGPAATGPATSDTAETEHTADAEPVLRVLAHDYFSGEPQAPVIATFEREHDVRVEFIEGGDANQVASALLDGTAPEADIVAGVDNLLYEQLVEADLLTAYESPRRSAIPADVLAQVEDSPYVTPVDYGYVTLNFDRAWGDPPTSWEELLSPAWRGTLVVQDPTTSSPGLQFLLTTVAAFGDEGDYTWRDYWAGLRENDVLVTADWGEAYTEHFTARNPDGERPLVVSYTTSPAAEAERSLAETGVLEPPPTESVILGPVFRQVELAAVLAGTEQQQTAEAFIDLLLSDEYQQLVPETDHVYPVIPGLPAPDWWRYAEVDIEAADMQFDARDIERWLREWKDVMAR